MRKMKKVYRMISLALVLALVVGNEELVVLADTAAETVSENQLTVSDSDMSEETYPSTVSDSDSEEYDEETSELPEALEDTGADLISPVEEYRICVQSMAADSGYRLTETQLLMQCSWYLQKDNMVEKYLDKCVRFTEDAMNDVSALDSWFASFMFSLKNGESFLSKEIAAACGITDSNYDKFKKDMAGELVREYMQTETCLNDVVSRTAKEFSLIERVYDLSSQKQKEVYKKQLKKASKALSDTEIDELTDTLFQKTDDLMKHCNTAIDIFDIVTMYIELQDMELTVIDELMAALSESYDSDLYDGLVSLRYDITSDIGAYFVSNYLTDKAIGYFADMLTEAIKGLGDDILKDTLGYTVKFSAPASFLVKAAVEKVASLYEIFRPSVNDIVHTSLLYNYFRTLESAVNRYHKKFMQKKAEEYEIPFFRAAYKGELCAISLMMKYAKKLTDSKRIKNALDLYRESIGTVVTCDQYIREGLRAATDAINAGTLVITEEEVTEKTDDGTIIDDSYDSTESITAKLSAIMERYPAGTTWTGSWGGAIQCFGFARMVFSLLFGCEMPNRYNSAARYKYTSDSNVELVGQLAAAEVTLANVKSLMQSGKAGDIIQASGAAYGQHTMVFLAATDSGVQVYDCNSHITANEPDCTIHNWVITYEKLAEWYGSGGGGYGENGISLYRASNYGTIYGNGDALFYDDSVNFVIEDGVLKKYNGFQRFVVIPDAVTAIGSDAFKNNKNMITVEIPDTVTSIGDNAFYGCASLVGVVIPDSVTRIERCAFGNCTNLSKVSLSVNLEYMGDWAFGHCNKLGEILIPKSLLECGNYSGAWGPFGECSSLKKVEFEEGRTKIPEWLFAGCVGLEEIIIPNTVTSIERGAFRGCTSLVEVVIPDSVTNIGGNAFYGCTSLVEVEIPKSVTNIGERAFYNCSSLTEINLPNSVTSMGTAIFHSCTSLTKVHLPEGRVNILSQSFYNCKNLQEINIPDSVEAIRSQAFYNCESLRAVELSPKLNVIEDYAFYNCNALESIVLPDSVTSIGKHAFEDCDSLADVQLSNGLTRIPAYAFNLCAALTSVVLPYRVSAVEDYAFTNCTQLAEVTIPRAAENFGSNAFSYPKKMTVYGIAGTYAETYAEQIGARFVNREVKAESVQLNYSEITINRGQSIRLVMTVTPEDFTDEVVLRSMDSDIASINDNGVITAKNTGTTTVKINAGEAGASCKVTVVQPVTGISLNKRNLSLEALDTYNLTAWVYPDNAANKNLVWSTSDEEVAVVSQNGKVTAIGKGTAVITAAAQDGSGITADCTIEVSGNGYICMTPEELESGHNYPVNCNDSWIYTVNGAESLYVTFDERTELEEGFDYLYLFDSEGNQIGKYTGKELAGRTIKVEGDTVKIKLVSDNAGCEWGFKVKSVSYDGTKIPEEKPDEVLPDDIPEDGIPEGLWVAKINAQEYSGAAVMPEVRVYDENRRLRQGTDYTVSYKNNKKVNDASDQTKAPAVIIKGKGNYTGSVTAVFAILPKNLEDTDILTEDLTAVCNGKLQKPVPAVTRNGKKLKNKTDFILEYPDTAEGAYKLPGVYTIKIKAKQGGGYAGERTVNLTILPETSVPVSKLTVARIPAAAYREGVPAEPSLTVKYKGKKLEQGVDYSVTYQDNEQAGTAKAVLTGLNGSDYSYVGTRIITFKITGTPISRARITVRTGEGLEYDGTVIKPAVTVTASAGGQETTLRENTDYTVEYGANAKAGKGTVRIKGMGGYTGTVKKTFTIKPYSINKDKITVANRDTLTAVYEKAGARPEIRLYFDGKELTAGTDYTISCKNNKKTAGREESKAPTVTVRGKDNFTGSLSLPFEITKKSLAQDIPDAVVITAADVTLNSKGNYRTKLTVRDASGKKLTEKKDYTVTGYYLDDGSGRELPAKAELTPGTVLKAVLQGTGNYCGTAEVSYRVTGNSLAKVSFKISPQTYTGEEIRFTEEDMNNPQILKVSAGKGKTPPVYGTDYIITGYSHNREKGKASVTFKGISDAWGGSRTVTFRITSKKMKWFWDLLG